MIVYGHGRHGAFQVATLVFRTSPYSFPWFYTGFRVFPTFYIADGVIMVCV